MNAIGRVHKSGHKSEYALETKKPNTLLDTLHVSNADLTKKRKYWQLLTSAG